MVTTEDLIKAIKSNNQQLEIDIIEQLSDKDLIVKFGTHNWTPLHNAACYGHIEIVKVLLERLSGEQLIIQDLRNDTPLHDAAWNGHNDVVRILLERLSDEQLIIQNDWGSTPLHDAARKGNIEVVRALLEKIKTERPFY